MAYDSPSVALMHAMTSRDVTDALNSIRHKSKEHLCEGEGRAGVYHASKGDATLAIKFVDERNARWHVQNTELFHFFELPFVPCRSLPLEKQFDPNGFCTETDYSYQTYTPATHVILMPFVKGRNFQKALDEKILPSTDIRKLNVRIMRYATPICLSHYWDCPPKNIIADIEENSLDETKICAEEAVTFVDAQHALFSQFKSNENLPQDVKTPFETLERHYMAAMMKTNSSVALSIQRTMVASCKFWETRIKDKFYHSSYDKPKQLQENLVFRTGALHAHLMTI